MTNLEDERARLTRALTDIRLRRDMFVARYAPILADRNRREQIERSMRANEKPLTAYTASVQKLAMVRGRLADTETPPPPAIDDKTAREHEIYRYSRQSLLEEQDRQIRLIHDLKPAFLLAENLRTQLLELRAEDPLLEATVEDAQAEFNIVQEDLRRVEAKIAEGGTP